MPYKPILIFLTTACLCTTTLSGTEDPSAQHQGNHRSSTPTSLSPKDQHALELGRKVLAISEAIENPQAPKAMDAVTDLGHDQRYYIMVRGWLSYQLQGDNSILDASAERTDQQVKDRIHLLQQSIRMLDLE